MNKDFVHLHVHTQYSLLDGACKIGDLIERAKELNMGSLAITDHGVMYGVMEFYKKAKAAGIKPVIGCEIYVAPRKLTDKDPKIDNQSYHLVLLAKDIKGYMNMVKLVSIASVEGFYYKPRVDLESLEKYKDGLIALSACLGGHVQRAVINDYEEGKKVALRYNEIFGQGNFYLELQDHGIPEQRTVNNQLVRMSKETGIPLVATNDIHYVNKEESIAQEVLLCIQTGKTLEDEDRMEFESKEFYLKSYDEMASIFPFAPEAIENTVKIAERCNVEFDFNVKHLPDFPVPENKDHFEYLKSLCIEGVNRKYGKDNLEGEVNEKLDYELGIISQMGYVDYFLIVWDFIKYARDNGIMVGPGRGSAAGSIVAYALDITDVDPIKYGLIFERFLNPERVTMPDIDCDFCYERRQEVIDYVVEKYGRDRVANIITFGTMAARAVIRDVGRAMNLPYKKVDYIAKQIPMELGMNLKKALEVNTELKNVYETDNEIKYLIDVSKILEGVTRHSSTHAAGVVISARPLDQLVPVQRNEENVVTQFTMTTLEELGLLKMDFLGLRTLTVLRDCVEIIKKSTGKDINLEEISYDHEEVYRKILWDGKTEGVFQLESAGMKQFMKELKPDSLEDIIAGISLYRPGPMDQIPTYINNKNNPEKVVYDHPKLKNILDVTYGCMVYQEQVMAIVRELAGYSMGRADLVRRAMSKKKKAVMEQERKNFINGIVDDAGNVEVPGCVRLGVSAEIANKLFDQMMDFASYAFNKSHAAAYAVIAYRTAYLKAYYPVQFMAATISSIMGWTEKVAKYIQECKSMGIEVLPPDINYSDIGFTVNDGKIRFGLAAIKNIGEAPIKAIIEGRRERAYKNFGDFIRQVDLRDINKRCVESLIKAGAFDSFGHKRSSLMMIYEKMIDSQNNKNKNNIKGQISLFDLGETGGENEIAVEEAYPDIDEFNKRDLLIMEKEVIGVYVSGHPLDEYSTQLTAKATINTSMLKVDKSEGGDDESQFGGNSLIHDNSFVSIGGIISTVSVKYTRNNDAMAFVSLEDLYGNIEVVVFPKVYETCKHYLKEDDIVIIKGRISANGEEEPKIICNSIESIWSALYIRLDMEKQKEVLERIKPILANNKGEVPVYLYDTVSKKAYKAGNTLSVRIGTDLMTQLENIAGKENIALK